MKGNIQFSCKCKYSEIHSDLSIILLNYHWLCSPVLETTELIWLQNTPDNTVRTRSFPGCHFYEFSSSYLELLKTQVINSINLQLNPIDPFLSAFGNPIESNYHTVKHNLNF